MSQFLSALFLIAAGSAFAQDAEVALTSFGHPVQVVLHAGALTWNLPSGDGLVSAGAVDWKGDSPTILRNVQTLILPDGRPGLAVVGSRSGRDGLFLLVPTWEGAELWGQDAWLTAPAGETITDYRWITDNDTTFTALWTGATVTVRAGTTRGGYSSDSAVLTSGTQTALGVWPWNDGSPRWAVVSAAHTAAGWVPSVWVWKDGRLAAQPPNAANTDLADAPAVLEVIPPNNGSSAVVVKQGSLWAIWSWQPWGATGVQTVSLPSAPVGSSTGRAGEPAFFWWPQNGQAVGKATTQLGSASLVDWAVNLPGTVLWNSDVVPLGDRWRVWLLLQTSSGNGLYRLEVVPQGNASLDRAGSIPTGVTALNLRFESGNWRVASSDRSQLWKLDTNAPSLTAVPSAPHPPLGTNP